MNGPFLRISPRRIGDIHAEQLAIDGALRHLVWKVWRYTRGRFSRATRDEGPAIIYKAGNCKWVPHIAKLQNEGAVLEDNKK